MAMLLAASPAARAAEPSAPDSASAVAAAFPSPVVRSWQTGFLRPDRLEHASVSFTVASALVIAGRDTPSAGAITLAAGVGKELWDRRGSSGFDGMDLAADVLGIALALTLVRTRGS